MKNFFKFLFILMLVSSCMQEPKNKKPFYLKSKRLSKYVSSDSLIIVNVGDFSSQEKEYLKLKESTLNPKLPAILKIGGIKKTKQYLEILSNQYSGKVLPVSANDITSKYLSNEARDILPLAAIKTPLFYFFKTKPQSLFKYPWVNSNVLNIKKGAAQVSDTIIPTIEYNKDKDNFDLSILAINHYEQLSGKEQKEVTGYYFQDSVSAFLKYKKEKPTVILFHGPTECEGKDVTRPISFKYAKDNQLKCPENDPLVVFLRRIPERNIDLIISSSLKNGAGFIGDTGVVFSGENFEFIMPVILSSKRKLKKSYLLPPIHLCHQVFNATKDCLFSVKDSAARENRSLLFEKTGYTLMPAKFLSHEVKVIE